jgi:hypothetical protein
MRNGAARASAIGDLHSLFSVGTVAGMSDGPLLEQFLARRDEAALEAIVARHGPMVVGVCLDIRTIQNSLTGQHSAWSKVAGQT